MFLSFLLPSQCFSLSFFLAYVSLFPSSLPMLSFIHISTNSDLFSFSWQGFSLSPSFWPMFLSLSFFLAYASLFPSSWNVLLSLSSWPMFLSLSFFLAYVSLSFILSSICSLFPSSWPMFLSFLLLAYVSLFPSS